jgi:hypothetical protein
MRVLAWLIVVACSAHADEANDTADQSKLTAGAMLMSDYIYRGKSSHNPSLVVGKRHTACFSSISKAFSSDGFCHE